MEFAWKRALWLLRFVPNLPRERGLPRKRVGDCVPERREIRVLDSLRPRDKLEIVMHELLHVAFPDARERQVATAACLLADVLWRLGYRR